MITIRQANISDVEALQDLYMNHLTAKPPEEPQDIELWRMTLRGLLSTPGYHLLVGCADGRAVCSVTLVVIGNLTHNRRSYAIIENVVTHAAYRKQGYASSLMDYARDIAREQNCYKIMLLTGSKRDSTLAFYERCGFNRVDKTGFVQWL